MKRINDLFIDHKTLEGLKRRRPVSVEESDRSFSALFATESAAFPKVERYAIGYFTSLHHRVDEVISYFGNALAVEDPDLARAILEVGKTGYTNGPYGNFPDGPLHSESQAGMDWRLPDQWRPIVGNKLTAALEHTHFLIYHPRDASRQRTFRLIKAGWTDDTIVSLSQLVSFLAYYLRVISGLQLLTTSK